MGLEDLIPIIGMTLVVFFLTTLYGKKNPFFSFAIACMMGVAISYLGVYTINKVYTDTVLVFLKGDLIQIVPMILGLLLFTSLKSKYAYIARIPLSIATGTMLALSMRTQIFSSVIAQANSIIIPLFQVSDPYSYFVNICDLLFTVTILSFFIYTYRRKTVLNVSSKIGEYVLYAAMGAILTNEFTGWGGTAIGVLSKFLKPVSNAYLFIGIGLVVMAAMYYLDKQNLLEKYAE